MEDYADVYALRESLEAGDCYILQTGWFYDAADKMTRYIYDLPIDADQRHALIYLANTLAKEAQVGGFLCGYSHHSGAAKYGLKARFSAKKEAER